MGNPENIAWGDPGRVSELLRRAANFDENNDIGMVAMQELGRHLEAQSASNTHHPAVKL